MIKSNFHVYINNYDDIEFNEKIKKVQNADRMQLNVNNENDLILVANHRSPTGYNNTNFFDDTRPRVNSKNSALQARRASNDIALGGMQFSNDDENQT